MTGRSALFGVLKSSLVLAFGAALGIGGYKLVAESGAAPLIIKPTPPTGSDAPVAVQTLGSIQPKGGVVEVALPAGTMLKRFGPGMDEGQSVKKDHVIAILEGYEARQLEVAVINAEIEAAEKALEVEDQDERLTLAEIDTTCQQALDLGKMEQESLKRRIEALKDKYELCRKQFATVEGLQLDKTISLSSYDQLASQAKISLEELGYARAEAERVARALKLDTDPEKIERRKDRARLLAKRARGQISLEILKRKKLLAEAMVEQTQVRSPIDGVVLRIGTKAGESGAGKPLVELGDTSRMYVLAELYEDYRQSVREGQAVDITGRGLPVDVDREPIRGTVETINPIIGAHKQTPLDPTSRDNARVFHAWIALDLESKDSTRKAGLESLRKLIRRQVDVKILVEPGPTGGR